MNQNGTAASENSPSERVKRTSLDDLDLSLGKRVRMQRLLYGRGQRNGTLLILPIDQGLEHGPIDFFPNPPSQDPDFQWRLALEGNYNGLACHYGLAKLYMTRYAGRVPLVLKLNGKTNIPSDAEALSTLTSTVDDAVALGADAVLIGWPLALGLAANGSEGVAETISILTAELRRIMSVTGCRNLSEIDYSILVKRDFFI